MIASTSFSPYSSAPIITNIHCRSPSTRGEK